MVHRGNLTLEIYFVGEICKFDQFLLSYESRLLVLNEVFDGHWNTVYLLRRIARRFIKLLKFVDTVYIRRLRTENDREKALRKFNLIFNCQKCLNEYPSLCVNNENLHCGSAMLPRLQQKYFEHNGRRRFTGEDPGFLRSLLLPMEVAAHCIQMNWPCLLVGVGGCGKSTIIKTISDLCNSHLEELCLTSSTDVSELIGNFEQTDKTATAIQFLNELIDHVDSLSLFLASDVKNSEAVIDINQRALVLVQAHEKHLLDAVATKNWLSHSTTRVVVDGLLQSLSHIHQRCSHQQLLGMLKLLCKEYDKLMQLDASLRFRWVDGILVQALEKGYWLHLENVNLCSSSVLDRSNPLLENCGELLLTECSTSCEGSNEHRKIKAHPNFRLLLSMDPSHGEIS